MECQFERNLKFKSDINLVSADDLRSQPLGKDKLGNSYWSMTDEDLNLRIYQEHLDEDIWKVVANTRDELVQLIDCLKGNAMKMPSLIGLVDEDSSSNSMPVPPKVDALIEQSKPQAIADGNELPASETVVSAAVDASSTTADAKLKKKGEMKLHIKNVGSDPKKIVTKAITQQGATEVAEDDDEEEEEGEEGEEEEAEEEEDEDDESNISEIDESSQAASDGGSTIMDAAKVSLSIS